MTTIASALNTPSTSNPRGYFSTKVSDRSQRKDALDLLIRMGYCSPEFIQGLGLDDDCKKDLLNDIYTALESGVPIIQTPQELNLSKVDNQYVDWHGFKSRDHFLKNFQDTNEHYDIDSIYEYRKTRGMNPNAGIELIEPREVDLKTNARHVFRENPLLMFEKVAKYPESIKRLVNVLDLPAQNDKGWSLTSQAAKAGSQKLANAFENAGFGPNLHTKAVVDFAKAMTEGSNAEKSAALKQLMGVTPLS